MLKKLFKIVTVLGLLGVAHVAYVRTFDYMVDRLGSGRQVDDIAFAVQDSETKTLVKETAARLFGDEHWTSSDDLIRYVGKEVMLFAAEIERPTERDGIRFDGKRIEFSPAALILGDPRGTTSRTMTSKNAVLDFNKPFGISQKNNSEPLTIQYAKLERDVILRDNRGTPDDPSDDLVVGPLTDLEYIDDGVCPVIRTDSDVVLEDGKMRVTGTGLEIQLRPRPGAGGAAVGSSKNAFDGAQRLTLAKNVRMTLYDVGGGGGMLPDTELLDDDDQSTEPVPLDVECVGPLIVDLPRVAPTPPVGPPEPPKATFVKFHGNVVVRRGKLSELPDQLDCDTLHLTLLPGEKKLPPVEPNVAVATTDANAAPTNVEAPSAFGGLELRRVQATGHSVWLQSPAQGVKIHCVELLHYKDPASGKNTTVFNGGGPKKLWVEKIDLAATGPNAGKPETVTHIWCADATLVDHGDMNRASLVANGPGLLESRPSPTADEAPRDIPPARVAVWRDQLYIRDWTPSDNSGGVSEPGKVLVLKGAPRVDDRNQGASLSAADQIVVWLNPQPKREVTRDGREVVPAAFVEAEDDAQTKPAVPSIRRLLAVKDVRLVDKARDHHYRERLDVDFEAGTFSTTAPPAKTAEAKPEPKPKTNPEDAPALTPVPDDANKDVPPVPAPIKTSISADQAHAIVVVAPTGQSTAKTPAAETPAKAVDTEPAYQLRNVELRGEVRLHQDPGPGKTVGTDASGEVMVLHTDDEGKIAFSLYHHDQHSDKGRALDPRKAPPARVSTEEMTMVNDTISLDQARDEIQAVGPNGKLTLLTSRGVLTDRPEEEMADDPARKTNLQMRGGKVLDERVPITLTWQEQMTFEGFSTDLLKNPAARITLYGKAHAEMPDALMHGEDSITIYTDKPISLMDAGKLADATKPKPKPTDESVDEDEKDPEARPDLSMIEIRGTEKRPALVISRKVHMKYPILMNQQRMEAGAIAYDRRSGTFHAQGPGVVYLYDRNGGPRKTEESAEESKTEAEVADRSVVRPVAYRPGDDEDDSRIAVSPDAARRTADVVRPKFAPLKLTQIRFVGEMRGRFGTGKLDDVDDQRWAEFFGAVETAYGNVANEGIRYDYDRLPADASFLTAETLRVISEPPPAGVGATSNGRNFLKAWDKATVQVRDAALQADIITYDSLADQVYAKGIDGNPVQLVRQSAPGQTTEPGKAQAICFTPSSGAIQVVAPEQWRILDTHTGSRPSVLKPSDLTPKNPTRPKPRPKVYHNPAELRGFSGR